MKNAPRNWDELSTNQKRGIIAVGAITSVWQAVMLWDLWKRPPEQIRGTKRAWVLASFVRPVGQVAYYVWGRRPTTTDPSATSVAEGEAPFAEGAPST